MSYYRIRFNQYPPPLECGTQRWWLMGGRVFGGRCGSNGMAQGWTWTSGGVAVRWRRRGHGGSMREGLAVCPGRGSGEAKGETTALGARVDPCQQCNYSSFLTAGT